MLTVVQAKAPTAHVTMGRVLNENKRKSQTGQAMATDAHYVCGQFAFLTPVAKKCCSREYQLMAAVSHAFSLAMIKIYIINIDSGSFEKCVQHFEFWVRERPVN